MSIINLKRKRSHQIEADLDSLLSNILGLEKAQVYKKPPTVEEILKMRKDIENAQEEKANQFVEYLVEQISTQIMSDVRLSEWTFFLVGGVKIYGKTCHAQLRESLGEDYRVGIDAIVKSNVKGDKIRVILNLPIETTD